MDFAELFSFDKRLAPQLIKPIYWIGSVLIVLSAIWIFVAFGLGGLLSNFFGGIGYMIYAIFFAVAGVLTLRVAAEVSLAVFEIHEKVVGTSTTVTSSSTTAS